MANVKISQLPAVSSVTGTDVLPVVATTTTSQLTVKNLANSLPQVTSSLSASVAVSASQALSANNATTASFVQTAQTASYVLNAVSASRAVNADNASTASFVANAQTASFVANAQTASYYNFTGTGIVSSSAFPYSGSAQITGSLGLTGSFLQGINHTLDAAAIQPFVHGRDATVGFAAAYAHAEGRETEVNADYGHAEGYRAKANATYAHAEGDNTNAGGAYSHAEGSQTATGINANHAHAEGYASVANAQYSHAEGFLTTVSSVADAAHAEGRSTTATGVYSHAEGNATLARGAHSHAEGSGSAAFGVGSHAEGLWTVASGSAQHVTGKYNLKGNTTSIFVIGNGTGVADVDRSDIVRVNQTQVQVTGSVIATAGFTGSFTGSFVGNGSGLTGVTATVNFAVSSSGSSIYSVNPATSNFSTLNGIFLGSGSGLGATNANDSNFLGLDAGRTATSANDSNFLGSNAGNQATNAARSNFLGNSAGVGATNASFSNFLGYQAGYGNANASHSFFAGCQAGADTTFSGAQLGPNNIIIGTNITLNAGRKDSINLGGVIFATGSYANASLLDNPFSGSMTNAKVGINNSLPETALDVTGDGRFSNGLKVTGSYLQAGGSARFRTNTTDIAGGILLAPSENYISLGRPDTPAELWFGLSGSLITTPNRPRTAIIRATTNGLSILVAPETLQVTGSLIMSGSIIPATGAGQFTSSFSLGSSTAAWKDLWVSNGTIYFLDNNGVQQGTLSASGSGISSEGDMFVATSGSLSIRLGRGVGDPDSIAQNTALGFSTLGANTSGSALTAVGASALNSNTVGDNNTAVGASALAFSTTANSNTAVGAGSLYLNQVGSNNTALGKDTLTYSTGNSNTAIGFAALSQPLSGTSNIALGAQAGQFASGSSTGNIYIGPGSGPTSGTEQNYKLYINHTSGTPLIGGDFASSEVNINGKLFISGSTAAQTSATFQNGHTVLTQVSRSLNFVDDAAATAGGVPLGGLYRSGSVVMIRVS
jgi:hypothetical protein